MGIDLEELERLAKAAGGEEWTFDVAIPDRGFCAQVWDSEGQDILTANATDGGSAAVMHTAAANPATILKLVERLKRAEESEKREREYRISEVEKWKRHAEDPAFDGRFSTWQMACGIARRERDDAQSRAAEMEGRYDRLTLYLAVAVRERDMLAAKLSEMERQGPVALKTHGAWDGIEEALDSPDGTALYARPVSTARPGDQK